MTSMGRKEASFPLKKQPGSNNWYVAYYTPERKRKYKSTGTPDRDKAILIVAGWRSQSSIEEGQRSSGLSEATVKAQAVFNDVTTDFFGKDCPYLKLRNISNSTRADSTISLQKSLLDNWIRPYFGLKRVSGLKPKDFEDFITYLKDKKNSSNQIHNILSTTKVILSTLAKTDRVPIDVSKFVPNYSRTPLKKKEFLTLPEFQMLLWESYRHALIKESELPLWTMFAICFLCGMRIGEIQGLRWANFIIQTDEKSKVSKACFLVDADWQEESGEIKDSTKNYGKRYVPVPDVVFNALVQKIAGKFLSKEVTADTGSLLIFASKKTATKPFYRSSINGYIKRECLRLNINKNVSPHRGRDWFKSQLTGQVEEGLIDYAIGHSQGTVEDVYLNAVFTQLEPVRVAINRLIDLQVTTTEAPAF